MRSRKSRRLSNESLTEIELRRWMRGQGMRFEQITALRTRPVYDMTILKATQGLVGIDYLKDQADACLMQERYRDS